MDRFESLDRRLGRRRVSTAMKLLALLILIVVTQCSNAATASNSAHSEEFEVSFLSLFGMKQPPAVDRNQIVIPQAMMDLYERQTGAKLDTASFLKPGLRTNSANTVRSFAHIESPIDEKFTKHHTFRLKFHVGRIAGLEQLKAAELTLTRVNVSPDKLLPQHAVQPAQGDNSVVPKRTCRLQVLVYDILQPGVSGIRQPLTRLMDTKHIDCRGNSSLSLDVLPAVQRWFADVDSNHGLLIKVHGESKHQKHLRLRRSVDYGDADAGAKAQFQWHHQQPLLYTYTDDGRHKQATGEEILRKRQRRSAMRNRRRKDPKVPCRRHNMYVDFTEVGWNNWIVAPPGYDAFYCHGDCSFPLPEHANATNHAIVQALVNSVTPGKVPKPCCVPTELNSISMLYLDDENKVVLKNYKEMTVVGCGCQ